MSYTCNHCKEKKNSTIQPSATVIEVLQIDSSDQKVCTIINNICPDCQKLY